MPASHTLTIDVLESIPEYVVEFKQVFGTDKITIDEVTQAIAEFEKTLVTPNSSFDRWLLGDKDALTTREMGGYKLFKRYCQLIIRENIPPHDRALSRCSGRTLGARDLLPSLKSLVTSDPVLSGFQTMAARAEEIVDTGMNREKALRLAS